MRISATGTYGDSFWGQRTEREKDIITWGGGVLAVVVAWSVLWAPAQEGRAHLRESLPTLQRQLAQMTAQANEARALRCRQFLKSCRRELYSNTQSPISKLRKAF